MMVGVVSDYMGLGYGVRMYGCIGCVVVLVVLLIVGVVLEFFGVGVWLLGFGGF